MYLGVGGSDAEDDRGGLQRRRKGKRTKATDRRNSLPQELLSGTFSVTTVREVMPSKSLAL